MKKDSDPSRRDFEPSAIGGEREAEEHRPAREEVMRLNAELELRVRERTAQLEQSNRELAAASQAAEGASRAKTEFLSSMSHELRTPLNAIIGFGQLLGSEEIDPTPARRREFAGHIVDAGRHLLDLINEILNLSQIEAGRLALSLETVRLQDILEECDALTRMAADQQGIRTVFAPSVDLHVRADRTRLKQVLLNLLSNAVKYNRAEGLVAVECSAEDEGHVRIGVRDTGPGLDLAQTKALFQPFGRLGRDRGIEGHGIGLALSKRLVELMGGRIGVSSQPGVGSTFWLDLRQVPAPEIAGFGTRGWPAEVPRPAMPAADPATVLCVDDNAANLSLLREALALRADLHVLTAAEGRAGLEVARHYRPDVILLNRDLPVLNGVHLLRALRDESVTCAIPVIGVTADARARSVDAPDASGYFRTLIKPFDLVDLIDAVDDALGGRAGARRTQTAAGSN